MPPAGLIATRSHQVIDALQQTSESDEAACTPPARAAAATPSPVTHPPPPLPSSTPPPCPPRQAVRALLARASSSDGGGSRSDDDRPYTPYSARSRQNRPFAGEAESPSTPVAGAEAAGAKLGAADASAASPAVEAGYGVEAEAEQARAEQSAEQPRHSDDAGARMRASHLWREGRIVAVGNARTPGPAVRARPAYVECALCELRIGSSLCCA